LNKSGLSLVAAPIDADLSWPVFTGENVAFASEPKGLIDRFIFWAQFEDNFVPDISPRCAPFHLELDRTRKQSRRISRTQCASLFLYGKSCDASWFLENPTEIRAANAEKGLSIAPSVVGRRDQTTVRQLARMNFATPPVWAG
jgi:hypothetical protein